MADLTIRSALDAIEAAINRDEKGNALVNIQNARNVLSDNSRPAAQEPPLKERMFTELNAVDQRLKGIDSVIHVCAFTLRAQACDIDADIAVMLDAVYGKVQDAQDSVVNAINLLPEVARAAPRGVLNNVLEAEDFTLLLLAIDLLDRHTSDELAKANANNPETAPLGHRRSRLLLIRSKLRTMQGGIA